MKPDSFHFVRFSCFMTFWHYPLEGHVGTFWAKSCYFGGRGDPKIVHLFKLFLIFCFLGSIWAFWVPMRLISWLQLRSFLGFTHFEFFFVFWLLIFLGGGLLGCVLGWDGVFKKFFGVYSYRLITQFCNVCFLTYCFFASWWSFCALLCLALFFVDS